MTFLFLVGKVISKALNFYLLVGDFSKDLFLSMSLKMDPTCAGHLALRA